MELSQAQARRIALAAQGFLDPAHATPTLRTFQRTLERTGVLQVDSVNVLQRAHYMPLYSRMGPYDPALLERASSGRERRRLVEYWAHVQALMPVELWPHMRFRRDTYRAQRGKFGFTADPSLDALIPTPPFPSYTSGHSTISTAAATVLGYLFPADEAALSERAEEAQRSRLWAGIHFPLDNEMGALGGGMIGRLVVARAREDGAG